MSQMRTSIKTRAGYRPANRQDGNKRCRNCNRSNLLLNCKLLGININPDYTCREYKPEEN